MPESLTAGTLTGNTTVHFLGGTGFPLLTSTSILFIHRKCINQHVLLYFNIGALPRLYYSLDFVVK